MGKRRPSGDGMVRKRPDGRWEGRIVVGHKADGSSIFRYLYADNQKELTARLRQEIDAYQGIDLTEDSRMTLAEWLNRWLEQMAPTLRPGTLNHYRSDLAHHVVPYLGQKKLTQLTSADLRNLYNILKERGRVKPRPGQNPGLSPTTVHGIHATLSQALSAAVDQGLMPVNPAGQMEPPIMGHSQFEKIPISHERQERLLQEQIDEIIERPVTPRNSARNMRKKSCSIRRRKTPLMRWASRSCPRSKSCKPSTPSCWRKRRKPTPSTGAPARKCGNF